MMKVCVMKALCPAMPMLEVEGCAERDSIWNGLHLSATEGTNRFAPNCDLWSSARNPSSGDSALLERLRVKRTMSKRVFRNDKLVMSEYLEPEPTAEVVGDQPQRAKSWSQTSWKDVEKSLTRPLLGPH